LSVVRALCAAVFVALAGMATVGRASFVGAGEAEEIPAKARAAYERYLEWAQQRFELQVSTPGVFLDLRTWEGAARMEADARLSEGGNWVRSLRQVDRSMSEIDPDGGIIHHWIGTTWVADVSAEEALSVSRDFESYPEIFAPEVVAAEVLGRPSPNAARVHMRFRKKKVITITIDTEQRVRFEGPRDGRAYSVARATRARQIDDAGEPDEHPREPADGFLWDLYNTWRFEESDGGLYIEHESVILSRKPPFLMRLIAGPLIEDGPREGVEFALEAMRRELAQQ
jgi:hypothetical protein